VSVLFFRLCCFFVVCCQWLTGQGTLNRRKVSDILVFRQSNATVRSYLVLGYAVQQACPRRIDPLPCSPELSAAMLFAVN
jgi:hypothetical protein